MFFFFFCLIYFAIQSYKNTLCGGNYIIQSSTAFLCNLMKQQFIIGDVIWAVGMLLASKTCSD